MTTFSLITATLNRKYELRKLLASLSLQTYKDFELIIVDQNLDNRLDSLIKEFEDTLNINHIKSEVRGLSRNRNIGIKFVKGEIIGFPDDDCEYDPQTLSLIYLHFLESKSEIITCNSKENSSNKYGYLANNSCEIERMNVFDKAISYTIFIKPKKLEDIRFDEKLGVGSEFGASEETDLLLNLLNLSYKGFYSSELFVYHPQLRSNDPNKILSYAKGFGALYHKEIFLRKNFKMLPHFVYDLCKRLAFLLIPFPKLFGINKNKYFIYLTFYGRLHGFLKYKA